MAITLEKLIFGSEEELCNFANEGLKSVKATMPLARGKLNSEEIVARIEAAEKLFNDSKYLESAIDCTLIWIMAGGVSDEEAVKCKAEAFEMVDGLICPVNIILGDIDIARLKRAIVYKMLNSYMWSLINREISLSVSLLSLYKAHPEKQLEFTDGLFRILAEGKK